MFWSMNQVPVVHITLPADDWTLNMCNQRTHVIAGLQFLNRAVLQRTLTCAHTLSGSLFVCKYTEWRSQSQLLGSPELRWYRSAEHLKYDQEARPCCHNWALAKLSSKHIPLQNPTRTHRHTSVRQTAPARHATFVWLHRQSDGFDDQRSLGEPCWHGQFQTSTWRSRLRRG